MEASWGENARDRRFLLASALRPEDARRSAAELPEPIGPCRHEPDRARAQAAASAVGDRWVFIEEPLLAPRASGESGGDLLARLAKALRSVLARESSVSLVMCDTLDLSVGGVRARREGPHARSRRAGPAPLLDHTTGEVEHVDRGRDGR